MPSLDEITHKLRRALPDLKRRYPIRELAVFGSYARDEQSSGSDLDILLDYAEAPSFFELSRLQQELEAITHVRVDLVPKPALKPALRERILREAVPV